MNNATRFWILFAFLMTGSLFFSVINFNEDWRETFHSIFLEDFREVLAQARGDLLGDGKIFLVVKVKTKSTLSIEVFEPDLNTHDFILKTKATLPEKRDGHMIYHENSTNLLLLDVNQDGALEIVAPTYDENLIPRVRVYKLNRDSNSLDLLNQSDIKI